MLSEGAARKAQTRARAHTHTHTHTHTQKKKTLFRESETTIKIKFVFFRGGGQGGREENCPKRYFRGKRNDNKNLKVRILLSRNFVVMAQAPNCRAGRRGGSGRQNSESGVLVLNQCRMFFEGFSETT